MRQIKKKRPVLVLGDEAHRFFRVALRQRGLVRRVFDDFFAAHQRHPIAFVLLGPDSFAGHALSQGDVRGQLGVRGVEPHVVAVRDAEVIIEALAGRQERLKMAKMPLADAGGRVAFRLENFRHGDFIRMQAVAVPREQYGRNAHALVVAAGKQCRAGA